MDNYSKFEETKIEDIGLITEKIYKNLKKNNINNLKQLLEIVDGEFLISMHPKTRSEFVGLLKLIKFKYLNETINLVEILNETPVLIEAGINKGKYKFNNLYKLGFDTIEANKINQQLHRYDINEIKNIRLIYILKSYPTNFKSLNGYQSKIQLNKINLLIECYYKEQEQPKKQKLLKELKRLKLESYRVNEDIKNLEQQISKQKVKK
ncbi:MAG: hypothetical protein J6K21_05245 [Bacilli bacterium]|nr:hypothetical protein [Bacilli bacterium]